MNLSDAREILTPPAQPIHFRIWSAANRPYNLCDIPAAHSISAPTRSVVTCKACLGKLR